MAWQWRSRIKRNGDGIKRGGIGSNGVAAVVAPAAHQPAAA